MYAPYFPPSIWRTGGSCDYVRIAMELYLKKRECGGTCRSADAKFAEILSLSLLITLASVAGTILSAKSARAPAKPSVTKNITKIFTRSIRMDCRKHTSPVERTLGNSCKSQAKHSRAELCFCRRAAFTKHKNTFPVLHHLSGPS